MESLLQLPLDPNVADADGDLPLLAAARHGRHLVVRLLLEAGAEKDSRGGSDLTNLMMANSRNYMEVWRLLLQ